MNIEEKWKRVHALEHAMQSGVAMEAHHGLSKAHEPKHLRTGVNYALVEVGAVIDLLVRKGLMTEDEVVDAVLAGMEREVEGYKKRLSEHFQTTIELA